MLATNSEQNQFRNIAEIKADAATIRAAVFTYLVPNNVALVGESPLFHDGQAVRQKRIWHPEIKVRGLLSYVANRQSLYLFQRHCAVTAEAPMLRRYFAGAILKPPWRISQNRGELFS